MSVINPLAPSLPAPPPVLPLWAKVLWYLGETVAIGVVHNQFDSGAPINPSPLDADDPTGTTWRHLQVTAADTLSANAADDQLFTIDLVNYTNGTIDNSWVTTDYNTVDTALNGFEQAIKGFFAPRLTFTGYKSYIRQFNPLSITKPFSDSGPPEHISTWSIPCTGVGATPPQICTTVTEMTPSPQNWGRFYTPTLAANAFSAEGRLNTAVVDNLASQVASMYSTLNAAQLIPVVPTTTVQKSPTRTLQGITGVRVDDVTDVVRRRRFKQALHKNTQPVAGTLPAP